MNWEWVTIFLVKVILAVSVLFLGSNIRLKKHCGVQVIVAVNGPNSWPTITLNHCGWRWKVVVTFQFAKKECLLILVDVANTAPRVDHMPGFDLSPNVKSKICYLLPADGARSVVNLMLNNFVTVIRFQLRVLYLHEHSFCVRVIVVTYSSYSQFQHPSVEAYSLPQEE